MNPVLPENIAVYAWIYLAICSMGGLVIFGLQAIRGAEFGDALEDAILLFVIALLAPVWIVPLMITGLLYLLYKAIRWFVQGGKHG